jgi:two-component system OmpR family sensor kinase
VSANLLEIRRPWTRTYLGARVFQLCFAVPAALTAVYATVLYGETSGWLMATLCWALAVLVIGLIARTASLLERYERQVNQNEWPALPGRRTVVRLRVSRGAEARLTHLEQVITRQQRFVSDVAHELRTPLTAQSVVGESVLARQAVTAAQLREAIVSMLEESKHMKRLIEGLLDLTRASLTNSGEQGGVSRQPVVLEVSGLARDCVESLRVLAEEKRQSIEVNAPAAVFAIADLTMVRQALLNVIHNAIEHCPEGTDIQVDTARSPNEALIRVQDNGPGIALDEQPYVFERFYRGAGALRQRSLGLGLSIAKALLCSQGGGIQLRSAPGKGCCFLLTLPLASRHHR